MMLTISYSQCLNDPTYCDDGKRGGAQLVKLFGVKPNQPIPLKDIVDHVTVPELLWCLRAVRKSQQTEAALIASNFVQSCLKVIDDVVTVEDLNEYPTTKQGRIKLLADVQEQHDSATNPIIKAATAAILIVLKGEGHLYSQVAIDVSQAIIKLMLLIHPQAAVDEETRQKQTLINLLTKGTI